MRHLCNFENLESCKNFVVEIGSPRSLLTRLEKDQLNRPALIYILNHGKQLNIIASSRMTLQFEQLNRNSWNHILNKKHDKSDRDISFWLLRNMHQLDHKYVGCEKVLGRISF